MQRLPSPGVADSRHHLRLDLPTYLPLRLWFRAMYHLTQSKQGISSIELGRAFA